VTLKLSEVTCVKIRAKRENCKRKIECNFVNDHNFYILLTNEKKLTKDMVVHRISRMTSLLIDFIIKITPIF